MMHKDDCLVGLKVWVQIVNRLYLGPVEIHKGAFNTAGVVIGVGSGAEVDQVQVSFFAVTDGAKDRLAVEWVDPGLLSLRLPDYSSYGIDTHYREDRVQRLMALAAANPGLKPA